MWSVLRFFGPFSVCLFLRVFASFCAFLRLFSSFSSLSLIRGALGRGLAAEELLLELMIVMIGEVVGEGMIESCRMVGRGTEHRAHASGTPVTV